MTNLEAKETLDQLEANQFEALYRCRWDTECAADVVPALVSCLGVDDAKVLHRALLALFRIGPNANSAADEVARLMFHTDTLICEVATHTLGGICCHCPERAIKPLRQVALDPKLQKAALFSLIGLGRGAGPAAAVFVASFESRDARIRRLAVRGLAQSGAKRSVSGPVLSRALKDRNGQVRAAAQRLARALDENE
jgi:HEAT repeat protein